MGELSPTTLKPQCGRCDIPVNSLTTLLTQDGKPMMLNNIDGPVHPGTVWEFQCWRTWHPINVTFGANYEEENVATLVPPVFWNAKTKKIPFSNWIDFNYVWKKEKYNNWFLTSKWCVWRFLTSISLSIEGVFSSDINTFFFCFELWILILPAVLGWRKVSIENRLRQKLKLL